MGSKNKSGKKSSSSETIQSSASADLLTKKKEPEFPEDYYDLTDEVDRDTLAEYSGSHLSDEPVVTSVTSVTKAVIERSGSDTSSKGHRTIEEDDRPIESEEEGELSEDHILNPPELVGLDPTSLEQRVKNNLKSNQRFLVHKENTFIKMQRIWNQIEEFLKALSDNRVLNDSEKRLLSITNGHLITLRLILSNQFSDGIDEDFLKNGGYTNTTAYNIMMHRITRYGLSSRQQYPQDFILSRETGLPSST